MSKTISLVLIDDNRLLREGLAGLIRKQPDFKILAASADIEEALRKVREAKPRVVLLDFGLEDHDSLRVAATVHQEVPEARVIVMGLLPLQEDVAEFVRAGASGFIMKDASFDDFLRTIRAVADGADVLPAQLTGSLFGQIAHQAVRRGRAPVLEGVRLTERERQVIDLIGEGLSNRSPPGCTSRFTRSKAMCTMSWRNSHSTPAWRSPPLPAQQAAIDSIGQGGAEIIRGRTCETGGLRALANAPLRERGVCFAPSLIRYDRQLECGDPSEVDTKIFHFAGPARRAEGVLLAHNVVE
jgi:DNA-binding NarL/FixJ family response regulator